MKLFQITYKEMNDELSDIEAAGVLDNLYTDRQKSVDAAVEYAEENGYDVDSVSDCGNYTMVLGKSGNKYSIELDVIESNVI